MADVWSNVASLDEGAQTRLADVLETRGADPQQRERRRPQALSEPDGSRGTLAGMPPYPLRRLRLRPGEEHREQLRLALEPFSLGGEPYAASTADVSAELVVQRAATGDVFRLSFETTVEGPCMRCLAPASVEVAVEAREYQASDPGADDELRSEYVADGELDVDAWARDQVALTLPDQILCRPDCEGLCPVCGKDLNLEPHVHDAEAVDPRWAALEALRGDSTAE